MNPNAEVEPAAPGPAGANERNWVLLAYILYALAPLNGVTAVAGVIINHLKIDGCADPLLRSHHRWLKRTFWFFVLWAVVIGLLHLTIVLIPLAWLGGAALGVWYLYRVIRGAINFSERRPVGALD
ncbi:MAG: hypothetical protein ISP90_09775 [Nevskia sp.]|nr:hypothetical protein [Nevskia sp.]